MNSSSKIRVAVNGYGVIGKRVADAIARQHDMALAGVSDIQTDWRSRVATHKGFRLFGPTAADVEAMRAAGMKISGTLEDLLAEIDVIVDCTPKKVAARNVEIYRRRGVKFILQGGEKHEATGHSFVAESSYAGAIGRQSTRVVSCNTTSIVRTLSVLKRAGLLLKARGTLLRRATDPWESHESGIMNTLVPEASIPSHQGPDAQTVDPTLDVVTMAVKVPETLSHVHYWSVQMTRAAGREEVLEARPHQRRRCVTMDIQSADYGLWGLVVVNSAVFILFAFSFFRPQTGRDWRSFGAFSAFLVALFAEMYGFPLTIYLASGWLQSRFPDIDSLSHDAGHLLEMMFGWRANPHFGPFHVVSFILIGGGFILISAAWRVLYTAQRERRLATAGPYDYVRHPQYVGFVLVMLGFLVQWPTLLTLAMFPILVAMYVRLSFVEEREARKEFGEAYDRYAARVPAFFPHWHRLFGSAGGPRTT